MKRCPKCFGSIRRMGHIEKPFFCPECKEWFSNEEVTPKPTNADRIRSMTDEELAILMATAYATQRDLGASTTTWLEFLKQESVFD